MSLGSQVGLPTGSHVGLAHPLASCGFPRLFLCWLPCAFPSKFSQWLAHWFRHWFLNCFPQWFPPLAAPLPPRWFPHWFLHWLANRAQPNPIERNQTPIESIRFNRVQSIIILNRIQSNPPSPINIDQSRQNPSNPPDSNRAPSLEVLPSAVGASCWDHVFVLDCVAMEWLGRYKASLETIQATVHTSITLWHNALVKMSSS